jgi:hypothetical protein
MQHLARPWRSWMATNLISEIPIIAIGQTGDHRSSG